MQWFARLCCVNRHPTGAGNLMWKLAMKRAAFQRGWANRIKCRATMRNGRPCTRLAMTSVGPFYCGAHGAYAHAVRLGLRTPARKICSIDHQEKPND